MDKSTAERLAAIERRFREINSRLAGGVREIASPEERFAFVCECSDLGCRETIELNLVEFGEVRADERRFAVVDGHEIPAIERVVERRAHYSTVEKIED